MATLRSLTGTTPYSSFLLSFVLTLSAFFSLTHAGPGSRLPASPGYANRLLCPARCVDSGPNSGNWSLSHDVDQLTSCQSVIFYDFNLYDSVDDHDTSHAIYACASVSSDWADHPANDSSEATPAATTSNNATYQLQWTSAAAGAPIAPATGILASHLQSYLTQGFALADKPTILYAQMGQVSAGLYIGQGLLNQQVGSYAIDTLQSSLTSLDFNNTASLLMQFCEQNTTAEHAFGLIVTGDGKFGRVQNAIQSWSSAQCLSYEQSYNFTGPLDFVTPLILSSNDTTSDGNATLGSNSTSTSSNSTGQLNTRWAPRINLAARDQCSTIQVQSGDGCGSLAQRCGITGDQLSQYNPQSNFCSTLQPQQHICCSAGTLPNFAPQQNSDGTCAGYTVQSGDSCSAIAASYSITVDQLNSFNGQTWGWNGCSLLWVGTNICLSSGTPPMPAPVANAVCGPQVPYTPQPASGVSLASLNPCPLNACCDIWGQCGTTPDFRTTSQSASGNPGTAAAGQNGCISNCGTDMVIGSPPSVYRSFGFFEGYNLDRPCLYQDVSQIDVSQYTHLVYSFGTLDNNFNVLIGDDLATYEFQQFQRLEGVTKILSIGGWDFSTSPSTYQIFRNAINANNRLQAALNIGKFIRDNDLDGVNIDYEYPGAPDIPGIPAADPHDGANFLSFIQMLRFILYDKEVSIAAPSSYWYLKNIPIYQISQFTDYIIYMTYDLHGQWDAQNQWSQIGCPSGQCLRSDVNFTETLSSLTLITKAGVPSNKVIVGVTSYGRSFGMSDANCWGPDCTYLGDKTHSYARPGVCTGTAGYIANAEINEILADSSRVNQNFIDYGSFTNILVYDNVQWVGYMSDDNKRLRTEWYQGLHMGGVSDWATDLQVYNPSSPQGSSVGWSNFTLDVKTKTLQGQRTGNWSTISCSDPAVSEWDDLDMTAEQRWNQLDCSNAWQDCIANWLNIDQPKGYLTFSKSVSYTLNGPENSACGDISGVSNCDQTLQCNSFQGSGAAAAYLVWNSLVGVRQVFQKFHETLTDLAALEFDNELQAFENDFAPVAPPPTNEAFKLLINLLTFGVGAAFGPFFDSAFKDLTWFKNHEDAFDQAREQAINVGTSAVAIAGTLGAPGSSSTWTAGSQAKFSAYLGQALSGWAAVAETQLSNLFSGTGQGIWDLTTLIQDGRFVEASGPNPSSISGDPHVNDTLKYNIRHLFFGFAIPAIWEQSGAGTFVLDSGHDCSSGVSASTVGNSDQSTTGVCFNNRQYYLVAPTGTSNSCGNTASKRDNLPPSSCTQRPFQAPPGINALTSGTYGGVNVSTLVEASVNTYMANGQQNLGPASTLGQQATVSALYDNSVLTAGVVRVPVCTADIARRAWATPSQVNSSDPNYPCVQLQGITDCWSYSYQDQTSSASASVSDCNILISNIEGTQGEWTTDITDQRTIATYGSCNFEVKAVSATGDATFKTGSQDIVNIINYSIQNYASNSLVGSSGNMYCNGDAGAQYVWWGVY